MKDQIMPVIAVTAIAIGAICIFLLFFVPVPVANEKLIDVSLGLVLGWAGTVITYYFGSSKSSADKTAIMDKAAQDLADKVPAPDKPTVQ